MRASERTPACEIELCGRGACGSVEHPQRGTMAVCHVHARRIEALPKDRFDCTHRIETGVAQ